MTASSADSYEVIGSEVLQPLVTASGHCVTAVVPLLNPAQIGLRINNAIRKIQRELDENGTDRELAFDQIAPKRGLAMTTRAPGRFRGPMELADSTLSQPLQDPVIVAANAECWGAWKEETHQIDTDTQREELAISL
jgi:hypothetical protein